MEEISRKQKNDLPQKPLDERAVRKAIYFLDSKKVECPIFDLKKGSNEKSPIYFFEPGKAEHNGSQGNFELSNRERFQQTSNSADKENQNQPIIIRGSESAEFGISNYSVIPCRKRVYVNRFGKEIKEREEILCTVAIENNQPADFIILTRDIKRLTILIGEKFSAAIVDPDVKNGTKILENNFRSATQGIPESKYYIDYGWQKIGGKRVYVHDDLRLSENIIFQTGMKLPSYDMRWNQIGQIFFDAYQLYADKGAMSVMISFSMLGILYRAFDEAGHKPHFVLFINGKTGSMKTTLSKILFIQLANDMYRDTPRRIDSDTVTSFERGIILNGRDTVTLIDDYAPAKSQKQKSDNEEKLERIIRMVGDGAGKNRSNPDLEDCRSEGVKGAVVLTGELIGKGLSSNLRCFYCGIQREYVCEDVVTSFQDSPFMYTTMIQYFALFVAEKWEKIVDYIKNSFQSERALARRMLSERRLVDSAAVLRITCEIIREFLLQCGKNQMEVNNLIEEMRREILTMAAISESISLDETLAVRFVKVIDQLLQNRKLKMIEKRPSEDDLTFIDGFYDEEFYYFLPDCLYEKVKRVFYSTNIYLPVDLDEIVRMLSEERIILPSPNGKGKKVYYARIPIGPNRKRSFIKIKKETIQKIAEE